MPQQGGAQVVGMYYAAYRLSQHGRNVMPSSTLALACNLGNTRLTSGGAGEMFGRHSRWAIGDYVFGFIAAGSIIAKEARVLALGFLVTAGTMRDIRISRR